MIIQMTNGNPRPDDAVFETYLDVLAQRLTEAGHSVTRMNLRDMDLRGCNGCWGCWVKTPGECVQPDDGPILRQAILQSDFHLLAAPLVMGFPSALLKTGLDKFLPLIHPYVVVDRGETHHLKRYERYPRLGLLVEPEAGTDAADRHIITNIFSRVALNMKSKLEFVAGPDTPVDELVQSISAPAPKHGLPFDENLGPNLGQTITPPTSLTVFNGSPRGKKGNTPLMLSHFIRGFESTGGKRVQTYDLNRIHDREIFKAAYGEAECVLLGFPLYVDAMPGQVKAFIESLQGYFGQPNNPPIGFMVQSGFPEGLHSRYIERYLEKLAARLGSPYLGTMVKGSGEAIQSEPEKVTAPLFETLYQLGRGFGTAGHFDPALLAQLVGMEKVPGWMLPLLQILSRTPMVTGYFDKMLKANGAYEQRYAKPYRLN
jgi:multimeric flavodoxin WrbA